MSIVRYSAHSLASLLDADASAVERQLAIQLAQQGVPVGPGERRSWTASLPVLARDLRDAGLEQVEVLLEHRLPLTSKRVDALLAGFHPKTGNPSYVVVELKQWGGARSWQGSETLVDPEGTHYRQVPHPSVQANDYVRYLRDFLRTFEHDPEWIQGVAYLHNAVDDGVADLFRGEATATTPLFTGQRRAQFHAYLRSLLAPGVAGAEAADRLAGSAVAPSKQLLSVASDEIRRREQFVLLDKQRVAHDLVLHVVDAVRRADTKEVVLVTGGPGSGKSVIALSLVGELARQGRSVLHATGSRSFTQTLRKVAGKGSRQTQELFKYFHNFMAADKNGLDVLILDEAHRVREKSVSRWTKKELRERARPQIDELIDAARVPVFLLDENQVVRPGEIGSVQDVRDAAARRGIPVKQVDLDDQFRAGGSIAYIQWVELLLGLEGDPSGTAAPWEGDDAFDVDVVDSPAEMESRLQEYRTQGYGARITAGYCWPWSDPNDNGSLVPDVRIGEWERPWNVRGDRRVGDAPPSALWATDPGGFGQVGCVYTAQGFEYDWNGVILGDDLVWRAAANGGRGGWVAQRERSHDGYLTRGRTDDGSFGRLIRNTYKVLLTRGMVGTLIYSTDRETREMLFDVVRARRLVP